MKSIYCHDSKAIANVKAKLRSFEDIYEQRNFL